MTAKPRCGHPIHGKPGVVCMRPEGHTDNHMSLLISTHGYTGYARGCRCETCADAKAAYMRARRTEHAPGTITDTLGRSQENRPRREKHWNWTGDDATYEAAHRRVQVTRGKPSARQCVDCGGQARQWSYDRTDPAERVSGDGHPYSLDVDRYVPRCASCHKKFDCAALSLERGGSLSTSPRCGKPVRLMGDQEPDVCGRPLGHPGQQHIGSRAYRRQAVQRAARKELRRRKEAA